MVVQEAAISSYIQSQLEYGKMWRLLEFADKMDRLLQVVSPPEVSFQRDCTASDVRGLIKATMEGADKKLEAMYQRVRKHLGTSPLALKVWERLKDDLMTR